MKQKNFTKIYITLSKIILTVLLGVSLYILGAVLQMKYCGASLPSDPEIISIAVEAVFAALVVYLSTTFLVLKFRSGQMY